MLLWLTVTADNCIVRINVPCGVESEVSAGECSMRFWSLQVNHYVFNVCDCEAFAGKCSMCEILLQE